MALPVRIGALRALLKEVEASARAESTLAVGGPRELAEVLRRQLARGAEAGAVRVGDSPEGAAALVYVLGRDPGPQDEEALKRARRARTPVVVVAAGPVSDDASLPYVLATDVVRVPPGEGFPLERIARVVAARLGEAGAPLAAGIPLLRDAVCAELISSFSRKNAVVGAAVFVPGADLPLLALNQARLVLRIAQAHGAELGQERLPELAATLGAGFGLRAAARELLDVFPLRRRPSRGLRSRVGSVEPTPTVPFAGWALKGAVAYAGTRALGEAAVRRFAAGDATPRPA